MDVGAELRPGTRIHHDEFGPGVVLDPVQEGYLRAFFSIGERRVPVVSVRREPTRTERVLNAVAGGGDRARRAWLYYEAHALPLMESASALTSARIDLLPHQIVLVHRIATASPRRYLIADEVGLGKTIETGLILRELLSRGELKRALMVVPAGLVNNWHRELNEVFKLDFEVFGSEGDITDRRTNAFARHDRLIASIDTLKRPERIRRLLGAPPWDLIVFDEAHHLTACRTGGKVRKTENYKLAEALKHRTRDLLMLSATPHQGDHFRFWMLIQLLDPTLFSSPADMVENRHRLNAVMFRRTKADACRPDGSALFARRWVHTESFVMSREERWFYEKLREYLEEGFRLSRSQGNQGRALGFLMAIFQKIAASSFAAVRRTLKRRLLMLTLQEALLRDRELDIDGREHLMEEARRLIHEEFGFPQDNLGRSEVDRVLANLKYRLVRKLDETLLEAASDPYGGEYSATAAEEAASEVVELHLPNERWRIGELLRVFPPHRETKMQKLLDGLRVLWQQNPDEKVVVFATYLGTVDLIAREIEQMFPGQGVVVLRGGDQGAKLAAERRFRRKDGPRVLVCTAAGREGINLQFARILFNFDLPWNPMDLEQRIGRIHRYGQNHTAQVYNLVLSDTIEGRIFLLLDEKLTEIARAVGKVDERGNVAEDLRTQILGHLAERLNYDRLYHEALSDPELKRTQVELEAALSNAREARQVVFELFQDLERFRIDDYRPFSDVSSGLERLVRFLSMAVAERQQKLISVSDEAYDLVTAEGAHRIRFSLNRESATGQEDVELMGLDHPWVQGELSHWRNLPPEEIGIAVTGEVSEPVLLSLWLVELSAGNGERRTEMHPVAIKQDGTRIPSVEQQYEHYWQLPPASPPFSARRRLELFTQVVEPALQRALQHKGVVNGDWSYSAELVGYVEIVGQKTR